MATRAAQRHHIDALLEAPWALLPRTLSRIAAWARSGASGDGHALLALDGPEQGPNRYGGVSVIDVYGVIENHSDWWVEMCGGTTIETLRAELAAELADPSVTAVVLEFDSPGGTVAGVTEFCAELRGMRGGRKPIVASVNTLAASAAYWIASQCDEVCASPSASVGSIGVYAVHEDDSRMLDEMGVTISLVSAGPHKVDGNPYQPLSDEARASLQERVDAAYAQFTADVAAGRRVQASSVEPEMGGGRVLTAKQGKAAGMVDRIETLSQTVTRLARAGGAKGRMAASAWVPDVEGAAQDDPEPGEDAEDAPGGRPFGERLSALASEAASLAAHAGERSRLRSKEGRPAFSTATEQRLRSIRGAIDELLSLDDPGPASNPPAVPADPARQAGPPVTAAPPTQAPRAVSREDFVRRLQEQHP